MAINPASLVLGEPVIDHDPGWAERAGAAGYPDAEPAGAAGLQPDGLSTLVITIAVKTPGEGIAPYLLEPILAAIGEHGVRPEHTEARLYWPEDGVPARGDGGLLIWRTHRE